MSTKGDTSIINSQQLQQQQQQQLQQQQLQQQQQHNPPSVYQPNPFPLNPLEGNPWATAPTEQPYVSTYQHPTRPQDSSNTTDSSSYSYQQHAYNNSSSDGSSSSYTPTTHAPVFMPMSMPVPENYLTVNSATLPTLTPPTLPPPTYHHQQSSSSNPYSTNTATTATGTTTSTGKKDEDTSASSASVGAGVSVNENETAAVNSSGDPDSYDIGETYQANPGITGHDPSRLNLHLDDEKPYRKPNLFRFISRFIQLIANIGAFVFILCAPIYSKQGTPSYIATGLVIGIYIVSIVSVLISFCHVIFYCVRRFRTKTKKPSRWILLIPDTLLGASYGLLMVFSIKDNRCGIGQEHGWCDFYNTSIFFIVLSFVTFALAFFWDITGSVRVTEGIRGIKEKGDKKNKSKKDKDGKKDGEDNATNDDNNNEA